MRIPSLELPSSSDDNFEPEVVALVGSSFCDTDNAACRYPPGVREPPDHPSLQRVSQPKAAKSSKPSASQPEPKAAKSSKPSASQPEPKAAKSSKPSASQPEPRAATPRACRSASHPAAAKETAKVYDHLSTEFSRIDPLSPSSSQEMGTTRVKRAAQWIQGPRADKA